MQQRIVLSNDYHRTFAAVITKDGEINARQVKRAWKTLCGIAGCTCGGNAGERPIRVDAITADRFQIR